jgi:hypothetical protein
MSFEERHYIVFNSSDVAQVDFGAVMETSPETLRYSGDTTRTFVKWEGGSTPAFVSSLTGVSGPYTHAEMIDLLSTDEWSRLDEEG